MTEHIEEQEMEAEALAAIFDTAFEITRNEQPFEWSVSLYPVDTHDEVEREEVNNVACRVQVELPLTYPDVLPIINVEVIKGLADEHQQKLQVIAAEEAESYMGMVAIYAVCEAIRTWLVDNNVKGLDDVSMHAQMLRKQMEAEQNKKQAQLQYESQKVIEEMTETEKEDIEVRRRRAEGTPCNKENFEIWKDKFEAEMALQAENDDEALALKDRTNSKKKNKSNGNANAEDIIEERLTGHQIFTQKMGLGSLELLEKAADEAAAAEGDDDDDDDDEVYVDDLDIDEDLFDDEDDLDDLDFDDDDEDDDDDEIDI
mmetsp:Transcript_19827/g.22489  ORF Transcript_19827/g.22489 Transcript_19827/m.22489 type:complete len:315 (-) Transcript_19827:78-1022(-)